MNTSGTGMSSTTVTTSLKTPAATINYNRTSSPIKKNEIIEKSLELNLKVKYRRESIKYGLMNLFILLVILYVISNRCPFEFSNWYYVEYCAAILLTVSTIFYLLRYMWYYFSSDAIRGNESQRKLLNFHENDTFVVQKPTTKPAENLNKSDANRSLVGWPSQNDSIGDWKRKSFHNTSLNNSSFNNSMGNSTNRSSNSSNLQPGSISKKFTNDQLINDEAKLQQYLKDYSEQEESMNNSYEASHSMTGIGSTINSYFTNFKLDDVSGLLKTAVYQLSPTTASQNKQSSKDDTNSVNLKEMNLNSELLTKLTATQLSQYVANLRVWISGTILLRLVTEINRIDDSLRTRGFSEIKIGSVGLERLKKTAENHQLVTLHAPMLPLIIPFLEMSTNQEYLVQRIKDLAKGSCMADYRWNSGSPYNGLNWDEHLPTDSAIIFHLFCTYLDSQLHPLPQPGGRPFYNRYVIVTDKKSEIKASSKFAILCTNLAKPKYNFIADNKIHHCVYDRNNLFYVIIQFLIYMRTHHDGMLEGVNLGRSGINILCVIED